MYADLLDSALRLQTLIAALHRSECELRSVYFETKLSVQSQHQTKKATVTVILIFLVESETVRAVKVRPWTRQPVGTVASQASCYGLRHESGPLGPGRRTAHVQPPLTCNTCKTILI
eukprot:852326-Amphidinium_carterae.1